MKSKEQIKQEVEQEALDSCTHMDASDPLNDEGYSHYKYGFVTARLLNMLEEAKTYANYWSKIAKESQQKLAALECQLDEMDGYFDERRTQ